MERAKAASRLDKGFSFPNIDCGITGTYALSDMEYRQTKRAVARRSLVLVLAAFFGLSSPGAAAQVVSIVTFDYPPIMGKNAVSELSVLPEIVRAAFAAEGVETEFVFTPVQRAILGIKRGDSFFMIGLMEYFGDEDVSYLIPFPLMSVDFDFFYLTDRFPSGFEYSGPESVGKDSIGVLLNGVTDTKCREYGLSVHAVPTLDQIFLMLENRRNDLGLAIDLAGLETIRRGFPGRERNFGYDAKRPFLSLKASAIINSRYPDYRWYETRFRRGLQTIMSDGTWAGILKRYYGAQPIPESSLRLRDEFLKTR